jgi:RNA polymerase sigma factor (sigma-70 family)
MLFMSNSINLNQENYNYWYNLVYAYFYRRVNTKEDADDLTSGVLSDFFMYQREIEKPIALIWGIARNKLKSFIYQKTKIPVSNENIEDLENVYSETYYNRIEGLINCAKKQLQPVDFDIVELSVLCDFDSKTVGEQVNLKPDNVRQKLSRSLKKLREKCRQIWLEMQS